ncbi:MAG: hypothetical protein ABSE25_09245 [Syntrophorhabdales bacterium]|jgi:hypothetical protein
MGVVKRLKKLEERCAAPAQSGKETIVRIRRFSKGREDLPPVEEQIARQRKRGLKFIVVSAPDEYPE